jgi:hypothetical protein
MVGSSKGDHGSRRSIVVRRVKMIDKVMNVSDGGFEFACDTNETSAF